MTGVAGTARAMGVTRLIHFTPTLSLPHIIRDGRLRPLAELQADIRACYRRNDRRRLDRQPGHTCCSIEYPNLHYLRQAQQRRPAFPDWVALGLSVGLLDREGALFYRRNAAATGSEPGVGLAGFGALYADVVHGAGVYTRTEGWLRCSPTDEQAEVLIPGDIPVTEMLCLLFPSRSALTDTRAHLEQIGMSLPDVPWQYSEEVFATLRLRQAIRSGSRPEEFPA